MQYLHLVYLSEQIFKQGPAGSKLRRYHGNGLITDGPFVETKEYRVSNQAPGRRKQRQTL